MTDPIRLAWRDDSTPQALHPLLKALGEEYPVVHNSTSGMPLRFEHAPCAGDIVTWLGTDGEAVIRHHTIAEAARGVGTILAGLADVTPHQESRLFSTLGLMLDCSRNAVASVDRLKRWLRRLALLGYNTAMLYTEDTYALPGEPYFGFMRGRYTLEELRDIDAYAAALGIELVPCIQTLGHLAQLLKWPAYREVKDTPSVLMVDDEATYRLVGKMLDFWREAVASRRIHIGMDEAHDLGRGRFMDRHGHRRAFDLFNAHLSRVTAMCADRGFRPMIWSDMYFRMGSKDMDYYDAASTIPLDVQDAIPGQVNLVYWDYYHEEESFYREWIRRHRQLGHPPVMASGIWTWSQLWCDHAKTLATAIPCLQACRAEGVDELIMTQWGDDGACCAPDSAMPSLVAIAELAFGHRGCQASGDIARRLHALGNADLDTQLMASRLLAHQDGHVAAMLWDDPLIGTFWRHHQDGPGGSFGASWLAQAGEFVQHLAAHPATDPGMAHAKALTVAIMHKTRLRRELVAAYAARDHDALRALHGLIRETIHALEALAESFRHQWLRHNKPFGLEVVQIRLAGQVARHRELAVRLCEHAEGKADAIPELDEPIAAPGEMPPCTYRSMASACPV